MDPSSAQLLAAAAGGIFALIVPPLFEGGPVPLPCAVQKLRRAAASTRRNRSATPVFWAAIAVIALGGICAHAGDMLTVKLQRQQIPLHSSGGVIYHKSAYYGTIWVGSPRQQRFDVVFDTGSGHLVLPSTMCRSDTCQAHRRYRRKASTSAKDIDHDGSLVQPKTPRDQITVAFGTGEVTGIFVEDIVCLDPLVPPPQHESRSEQGDTLLQTRLTDAKSKTTVSEDSAPAVLNSEGVTELSEKEGCVRLRTVAAIEMSDEPFSSFEFDGILGLGLPGMSQTPEFNFFNMGTQHAAWNTSIGHIFGVFLATSSAEDSEITFGGVKTEHIADGVPKQLAWVDVQDAELGYWQIKIHAIRIGNKTLDYCQDGCRAVVDTGTSLLGVPTDAALELRQGLKHPTSPDGDCRSTHGPEVHFDLGNFTVSLGPRDYARKQMADELDENTTEPSCVPMMMLFDLQEPLGSKLFILGEPVLQRYYSGFDSQAKRVGFALAKHAEPNAPDDREVIDHGVVV